ncbi:response regulator transcription factor [Xanthocytophaga flava]|uniref:response regulator transcription factor n=1 Tax=Xanthocytophaga flava TaxID=3048013 RepID=UPI0028D6FEA9|nr:response regulator transcription factor [Xanthocytophaga flavus]MDJ1470769.1 response regulator transcription factor [Xanthocytophaga flavus]
MINLLLADDHKIIRDGLKAVLTFSDASIQVVAEASNGKEVLEQLEREKIDVVLLDMNMPEMDGLETTTYIARNYPETKVLILSMVENEHLIAKVFQAGAQGYLLKSAGREELIHAIEIVHKGSRYVTAQITLSLLGKLSHSEIPITYADSVSSPVTSIEAITKSEKLGPRAEASHTGQPEGIGLSKREMEILQLVAKGYTNAKIADLLFTSKRTIENHRQSLLAKTGCNNTAMLIHFASSHHLLD